MICDDRYLDEVFFIEGEVGVNGDVSIFVYINICIKFIFMYFLLYIRFVICIG